MSRPIRVLNVAEKPSVAKSISTILSGSQNPSSRAAHSRYNRVFEFQYTIRGQTCHMLVTSVLGHLMELDFSDPYRKWHSCDPASLYEAPVRKFVPQDKLDLKRTLEEEARGCQWLILWLDNDREGENIAFEVVQVCTAINSRLNVWRARFSALTPRDINEAAQNLVRPNQAEADAVDVRQEIDLRIGASFTRFQTMFLKDEFAIPFPGDDTHNILSYGPCQFPTLGFIVERYWDIQAHEPEEFWFINCSHVAEEGTSAFNWMRGRMFDYSCAVMIYEMCVQEPTATVTKATDQKTLKHPPFPLSTIELEKRASWYFRMSSAHTMKVAEDLYNGGFISYPRTETDSFSERTDLKAIVQEQQGHPVWGSYAQRLLDPGAGLWSNPRRGRNDDKAHPPIHPTKFSSGQESGWTEDHKRLYELVVRHFLACVSKPAVGAKTTVEIDIAGESFSASGCAVLERNYLDIYRFESWGNSVIPRYVFGQQFIPSTLTLDSGVTRPPPLLNEADLLSCMDKAGIGTDATMHDHIKKLLDRSYATKDANSCFSPTNLGEALVMGYDDMGYNLWKPDLRSCMESDMKLVGIGRKSKTQVLLESLQQMKACFLDARTKKEKLSESMELFFERTNRASQDQHRVVGEVVRRCGLCNEFDMVLKRKPDGNFMVGCLGFPQCRNVVWLPGSISEATVTTQVCNSCNPGPVSLIQFKFRQLEIPPGYDVHHLGCIGGCDEILRQLIDICGTGSRNPSSAPVSSAGGRGTRASSSNAQQTNTRQDACIHCRQTGHSSNDCPSQMFQAQNSQSRRRNTRTAGSNGEASVPCGTCGQSCVLRTANTPSNSGRKFYSCQSRECNFFVWEDSMNNSTGATAPSASRGRSTSNSRSGTARRGGRGRGSREGRQGANSTGATFVSPTGDPISGRCYRCGDPSHFANVCPNRDA